MLLRNLPSGRGCAGVSSFSKLCGIGGKWVSNGRFPKSISSNSSSLPVEYYLSSSGYHRRSSSCRRQVILLDVGRPTRGSRRQPIQIGAAAAAAAAASKGDNRAAARLVGLEVGRSRDRIPERKRQGVVVDNSSSLSSASSSSDAAPAAAILSSSSSSSSSSCYPAFSFSSSCYPAFSFSSSCYPAFSSSSLSSSSPSTSSLLSGLSAFRKGKASDHGGGIHVGRFSSATWRRVLSLSTTLSEILAGNYSRGGKIFRAGVQSDGPVATPELMLARLRKERMGEEGGEEGEEGEEGEGKQVPVSAQAEPSSTGSPRQMDGVTCGTRGDELGGYPVIMAGKCQGEGNEGEGREEDTGKGEREEGGGGGGGRGGGSGIGERRDLTSVSIRNFDESLGRIQTAIEECDFVALDLEMTGVESTKWRRNIEVDTSETRYLNLKNSAENFAILQVGICTFKWEPSSNAFVAQPYNFFLFPRSNLRKDIPSRIFLCQVKSLEFLSQHKFDFNQCIYEGISYLSEAQEAAAVCQFEEQERLYSQMLSEKPNDDIPLSRTPDIVFSESIRKCIGRWRDHLLLRATLPMTHQSRQQSEVGDGRERGGFLPDNDSSLTYAGGVAEQETFHGLPSLLLGPFSHLQSKLARQAVRRHFKDVLTLLVRADSSGEGSDDSIIHKAWLRTVFTMNKEEKDGLQGKLMEERKQRHKARLHASIGFRHVIDLISASGKLVVAHNSFLDLAHIHSKFIGPLPCQLKEFCAGIQRKFPRIVDTKFLLKAEPRLRWSLGRKTTSLSKLYAQIVKGQQMQGRMHASGNGSTGQQMHGLGDGSAAMKRAGVGRKVKVDFPDGFMRYSGGVEQFYHEAGFDAYMTGVVFAQACSDIGVPASELSAFGTSAANSGANDSAGAGFRLSKGLRELSQYVNAVIIGWIGSMTVDIAAGKAGVGQGRTLPEAGRSRWLHYPNNANVVLVWGFSRWLGSEELRRTIAGIFIRPPPVQVFFVDSQAALVQFNKDATATTFLTLADGCHNGGRDLTKGMQAFTDAGIQVAPFSFYRDLCLSPSVVTTLTDAAEALMRERRLQMHQTSTGVAAGSELAPSGGNKQEIYKENPDPEGRHRHLKRPVHMLGSMEYNPKRQVLEHDEMIDAVEQTGTEMDPGMVPGDAGNNMNNLRVQGRCETGSINEEEEEENGDNNGGVKD